jgi:hypothetical protein
MAAEAEALIERGLVVNELRADLDKIREGQLEAALRAAGYTWQWGPHGKIWFSPKYPKQSHSEFIPTKKEEQS